MEMLHFTDSIMNKIIIVFSLIVAAHSLKAQQAYNSSLWMQSPSIFNAGAVATGDEDYSFFTNCRLQYLTMNGSMMRTNSLSAGFKMSDGAYSKNNFGFGINVINDQSGDNQLMTNAITIPINYSIQMDERNKLSVGVAPGVYLQSYDPTLQNWESNWNSSGFNGNIGDPIFINSTLSRSSYGALDVNAGIHYQHIQRNKNRLYSGIAMNHLSRQKINFTNTGDKLYAQIVINAGADLVTKRKDLKVQPQIMYFRNGTSNNLIMGLGCEHILESGSSITNINKSKTFSYAAYYRWNDAVVATINYKFKNFKFGLAFDANISRLNSATSGIGAVELYFKSIHIYRKKKTKIKK
jgi:type IX secretion system PorP/SprF family membrane protein